ncbi:MAG TPA: hypothetical protein VEI97_14735 [bacterium]|nr:hypothetical protein [bacterium]
MSTKTIREVEAIIEAIKTGIQAGGDPEDWEAGEFEEARSLTAAVGWQWEFTTWLATLRVLEGGDIPGAGRRWDEETNAAEPTPAQRDALARHDSLVARARELDEARASLGPDAAEEEDERLRLAAVEAWAEVARDAEALEAAEAVTRAMAVTPPGQPVWGGVRVGLRPDDPIHGTVGFRGMPRGACACPACVEADYLTT